MYVEILKFSLELLLDKYCIIKDYKSQNQMYNIYKDVNNIHLSGQRIKDL